LRTYDAFHGVKTEKDFQLEFQIFLKELVLFEDFNAKLLFNFFFTFCEAECCVAPDKFFMTTMLSDRVISPAMADDPTLAPILVEFFTDIFQARSVAPSEFLRLVFRSRRDQHEQCVNLPLIRLFWRIANDSGNELCVDSIMTKEIVEKFGGSTLVPELLSSLQKCPPPIISDKPWEQISPFGRKEEGTLLGAAYFSLLPAPMQSHDFSSVFRYFTEHVSRSTSAFWTLWLRDKAFYVAGFPVQLASAPRADQHMDVLCQEFTRLLFRCTDLRPERTSIFLNCWMLLCQRPSLAARALASGMDCLTSGRRELMEPIAVDYIHPVLTGLSQTSDAFECLIGATLNMPYSDADFDSSVHLIGSI
jgi:hypothetical protein